MSISSSNISEQEIVISESKKDLVDELKKSYEESTGNNQDISEIELNTLKTKEGLLKLYERELVRNKHLQREHKKQLDYLTKYFYIRKSNHLINSSKFSKGSDSQNDQGLGSGSPKSSNGSDLSNNGERYYRYVREHMKQRKELENSQTCHKKELSVLKQKLSVKRKEVDKLSSQLLKYKLQVAKESENSRTGKKIDTNKLKEFEELSKKKDEILRKIRTKYLLLVTKKQAIDDSLKNKEFSNGLHLIDFEQYKMENAQLNDKIEEKNEALQKSKLKATETVHILTHVNEKLQFIQEKDVQLKRKLASLEEKLKENKDYLTHLKKERDAFKTHNQHLKDTNPLIGNNSLLEDYETRKTEMEQLKVKLKNLQTVHSNLTNKTLFYQSQIGELERRLNKMKQPQFHSRLRKGGLLPFY